MFFDSAEQMLNTITNGIDLWNPNLKKYVFVYDENDSLCVYELDEELINKLTQSSNEYWSSYLEGDGDVISHENALSFCEKNFSIEEWFDTKEITSSGGKIVFNMQFLKESLVLKREAEKNQPRQEKHMNRGGIEL